MKKIDLLPHLKRFSTQNKTGGFILGLTAAGLWGLSGTAAQILFQVYHFPPLGLVTIRLFAASAVLFAWFRPKWPHLHSSEMIIFGVLGILPSQLFYFLAIDFSNVAVATLLQLLFLPMVAIVEIITRVHSFTRSLVAAISLSLAGSVFLVLNGTSFELRITPLGFTFGILCALAAAYYSLGSRRLGKSYNSWSITAWGFLIGGIASIPIGTPSLFSAPYSSRILALVIVVVIFGTLLSYSLYVRSLQSLTATEASITAATEPIVAILSSYLFVGLILSSIQYLGGGLILISILFLTRVMRTPKEKVNPPEV